MCILGKLFATKLASVRFFACMQLNMRNKIAKRGTFFTTLPTFGSVARVLICQAGLAFGSISDSFDSSLRSSSFSFRKKLFTPSFNLSKSSSSSSEKI
ncbi:hypothetical protein BpHYR1_047490 [Brachionus plicatilis]|uniref:Uncharacterized protein n=1 Tax=Brachionus plicatilis TaxID=10195 RepID=A0A3M7QFK8_BRAPC|nr:hypothetical protein BpHYR1_047490 [Brachionus plicatilis]